jgi:hypothetical protein
MVVRRTWTVLGAMVVAATMVGACKEEPPPKQTRTGEPVAPAATFKLRVEKVIGLEQIVLAVDGKVVGQASKPHEYIDVELPAGELLSDKKGLVSLRVDTTCGEADDVPLEASGLDKSDELRARRSQQKKFVEMKVSADHPKLHIYVDNPGSQQAAVRVGKIDITVPARGKQSRLLYLGACDEARTVTTPAGEGKLEGTDPAAYLVDTIGHSCYRAEKLFFTPGGSRPPAEDQPLGRGIVHRLPMAWVDHFLEPAPKTLSKELIMREGKEVSGERLLTRRVVRRAPCR